MKRREKGKREALIARRRGKGKGKMRKEYHTNAYQFSNAESSEWAIM